MNAIRRDTILALAVAFATLTPGIARAGANETPGQSRKPHTYSAYLPVSDEFGPADDAIFQKYVVKSQHYSLGAIYSDKGNDLVIAGADPWNFFTFCTNRAADVMLVSSHGLKGPTRTLIAKFPGSAAGKSLRDSLVTYYTGIFGAGRITGPDFTDGTYGICVTQAFYTAYFQTPQAFCWWATCFSSLLSMTGVAEARAYLGYTAAVTTGKCLCDEEYVLNRMDGQQGQDKRPLSAAFAGVNTNCPDLPPPALLAAFGKLNTVLSPSVLDYGPKGIVCSSVPGYVYFDCTMDTAIPAAAVVSAYGDGFLVGHTWVGDDRVTFTVVPTTPCPNILYDVHERTSISLADNARLDGNTRPPVNARGPNQDDFIWTTFCPFCNTPFWYPTLITTVNPLFCVPNAVMTLYSLIVNQDSSPHTGTVTCHVDGITLPIEIVPLTLAAGESQLLTWDVPIPITATDGQVYPVHLTATPNGSGPYTVDDVLTVGGMVSGDLHGAPQVNVGSNGLTVELTNHGQGAITLTGMSASGSQGWGMSVIPNSLALDPGASALVQVTCAVPPSTPNGTTSTFQIAGSGSLGPWQTGLPDLSVHLPVQLHALFSTDAVPGCANATVSVELLNTGDHTLSPSYTVTSARGFAVSPSLPVSLDPGIPATGTIQMSLPADPTLIGRTDELTVHLDAEGYDNDYLVPVEISSALEIDLSPLANATFVTGYNTPHSYASSIILRNHSDQLMSGTLQWINQDPLPLVPLSNTINVSPHSMQVVPMQLQLPPDFPFGVYRDSANTTTSSGLGNNATRGEVEVVPPVTVQMRFRASSGPGGQPLAIFADVTNRTTDRTKVGSLQWTDPRGWITGGAVGTYNLGPGATAPIQVTLGLPASGMAPADTDSVTVQVFETYDDGSSANTRAVTEVHANHTSTTDVPPTDHVMRGTDFDAIVPNPLFNSADVSFHLATTGRATVEVIDPAGRRVATLVAAVLSAGPHQAHWDGRTDGGGLAPSGIYFLRLHAAGIERTRKAVMMR